MISPGNMHFETHGIAAVRVVHHFSQKVGCQENPQSFRQFEQFNMSIDPWGNQRANWDQLLLHRSDFTISQWKRSGEKTLNHFGHVFQLQFSPLVAWFVIVFVQRSS